MGGKFSKKPSWRDTQEEKNDHFRGLLEIQNITIAAQQKDIVLLNQELSRIRQLVIDLDISIPGSTNFNGPPGYSELSEIDGRNTGIGRL